MLLNYPWHSKVPVLGCFTSHGRILRSLYKGEVALGANHLYRARCHFAAAAVGARRNGQLQLEMLAKYAAGLVAEAQELPDLAAKYLDDAVQLCEQLPEDDLVEKVRGERERVTEQLLIRKVDSKLRSARIACAMVEVLEEEGSMGYGETPSFNNLYGEALEEISQRLGYRHWLTAAVFMAMANNSDDYSAKLDLYRKAYHIAREFPDSAKHVLEALRANCQELDQEWSA